MAGSFDRSHPCESHYRAKLVMRILCLLFSFIGIATSGYAWYICIFLFFPFGASIIWNFANIVRRLTARTPVHPGANVGIDLILWLLFFIFVILTYFYAAAALYVATNGSGSISSYNGTYWSNYVSSNSNVSSGSSTVCTTDSYGNESCTSTSGKRAVVITMADLKTRSQVGVVSSVFGTLSFLLHFVLFVIACVDTHRRRNSQRFPEYQVNNDKMGAYSYPPQQTAYPPQQAAYPQNAQPGFQNNNAGYHA